MTYTQKQEILLVSEAGLAFDLCVSLVIDEEGAEYIALIMEREYARSGDRGALQIANGIKKAMFA